jgi:hypothetical protein
MSWNVMFMLQLLLRVRDELSDAVSPRAGAGVIAPGPGIEVEDNHPWEVHLHLRGSGADLIHIHRYLMVLGSPGCARNRSSTPTQLHLGPRGSGHSPSFWHTPDTCVSHPLLLRMPQGMSPGVDPRGTLSNIGLFAVHRIHRPRWWNRTDTSSSSAIEEDIDADLDTVGLRESSIHGEGYEDRAFQVRFGIRGTDPKTS